MSIDDYLSLGIKHVGIKHDEGKPPLDLIDPEFQLEIARVLGKGALKYAPYNWQKGMCLNKVIAAVQRHVLEIRKFNWLDPEWNLRHTAHAACGLMFLDYYIRNNILTVPDDRWIKP